ncbi:CCA tRNA nucleotidyltransferase [Bacillus sp. FJAT-42376]|uniref:CCA tRNA nucleotidyltransferase n=1 Tax=Bacillus sp. FJAT-42376 TaxID=2014076 RepID=UPI000F4EF1FB|nr:CCA tRNA nucleotidyltransferase [Bacillus sp. FJAT-42376]AZB43312.1 CCA tRNA nucleotidyltransferase [Bacillus sp. FJAT-42376]
MEKEFLNALPIISKLEKEGYEAYFVGGAVRDSLLGREIHDVDIATSAVPAEVQRIFVKTADVGAAHGTVLVLQDGESYEVTTFRTESGYADFRRPEKVDFVSSLKEDLKRRDFTMNAIAMDKNGTLHDYFSGREALRERRIETVGKAEERFTEDALRMLRALRFSSQLDFMIADESVQAIRQLSHLMEHISIERKLAEFDKLLTGQAFSSASVLLERTGLIRHLPGLDRPGWTNFLKRMLSAELGLMERWALLLFDLKTENPAAFLKRWKMSSKRIDKICSIHSFLLKRLNSPWTNVMLYEAGEETVALTEKICSLQPEWVDEGGPDHAVYRYRKLPIHSRNDLKINGNDLLAAAEQKPGPWIAEALRKIELEVLAARLPNSSTDIKRWFVRWSKQREM